MKESIKPNEVQIIKLARKWEIFANISIANTTLIKIYKQSIFVIHNTHSKCKQSSYIFMQCIRNAKNQIYNKQ